jgi:hypothetical protein
LEVLFGVLVAAQMTRKKCLGLQYIFLKDLVKNKYKNNIPTELIHSCTSKKSFKNSQLKLTS